MKNNNGPRHVVIVGGGFAGVGCARKLVSQKEVRVTLIDKNNYHQFQPLLYQVASSLLAPDDVAVSLRKLFHKSSNVDVKMAEVVSVDPMAKTVITSSGEVYQSDYLVLAAGSQPNFFRVPGAEEHSFPLYSLNDAERLRSRILKVFEDADRDPNLVDQGALNFVIVGGGPTGVEMAGSLAEMINNTMTTEYRDLAVTAARVYVIDHGQAVLGAFSQKAHEYAAGALKRDGVQLRLGVSVQEVGSDHVTLSDGTSIKTRSVIWCGGVMAAPLASKVSLPQGRGGRINVLPDLTVDGFPGVYVLGDLANIPSPDARSYPQLGSVALQTGTWAAQHILSDIKNVPHRTFHYRDKGFMAMIGHGAAIAEIGEHRHELHGPVAFAAWLGVHVYLMSGVRNRIEIFVDWAWDCFTTSRGPQELDRSDAARIDWGEDEDPDGEPDTGWEEES
jgi:NADH:ubiquinone reductase (H+-translocating)